MIDAEQARRETQKSLEEAKKRELARVEAMILGAVRQGEDYIYGEGMLYQITRQRLEELGYQVETRRQYNESHFTISWRKK